MILVTGSAGFIGFHLCKKLLGEHEVIGVDDFNSYYNPKLKEERNKILKQNNKFKLMRMDFGKLTKKDIKNVDIIFHKAAYAGVRYSIENPLLYDETNVHNTVKLLKLAVDSNVKKIIYASSSSVYGNVKKFPTPETQPVNPVSPYGVSKLSGEKYCDAFYNCFGINTISLRYFTVYGPWGRPDMFIMSLIESTLGKGTLTRFKKEGKIVGFKRDFSFIDHIVEANILAMKSTIKNDVFNVASGKNTPINDLIEIIKKETGKDPKCIEAEATEADPLVTWGDISKIKDKLGYRHPTTIEEGFKKTLEWYKNFNSNLGDREFCGF